VPGTCKTWGVVRNGRGGLGSLFGGEKNRHTQMVSRQPKSGRQTSTRKADGRGRREKTPKFAACVVDSLMSTTRLVGLLIVHGHAQCPSRGSVITTRQG
jgi:hypothetical protein